MRVIETEIPEVLVIEPTVHSDERGFFLEIFQEEKYLRHGISGPFVQDNLSRSRFGVVRGLHLQVPAPQAKLVSVLRGAIFDVAVDVRLGSPTFGRYVAIELSEENRKQLWVPRGFAHGFAAITQTVDLFYKCDRIYAPEDEVTIRWNDPAIGIDWRVVSPTLSPRDATAPLLADVPRLPVYGAG